MAQGIVTFMKYLAMVLVRGISVENTDNLNIEVDEEKNNDHIAQMTIPRRQRHARTR